MEQPYEKIGKQLGFSYAVTFSQLILAPLLVGLLTRVLEPGRYGVYALLFAFISLGASVLQLGMSQYIITKLYSFKEKEWPQRFFTVLSGVLIILLAFSAVFYFTPVSGYFLSSIKITGYSTILVLSLLALVFVTIGRIYDYYYKARQKINIANFMELLRSQCMALPLLLLFILYGKFSLAQVFISWAALSMLSVAIYAWLDRKDVFAFLKSGGPQKNYLPNAVKFGLPVTGSAIFSWALAYIDRYMLGFYTTTTFVGIYAVASSILGVILSFSVATSGVIFPYFAEAWWKQKEKYKTFLNATLKYGLIGLIPGIIGAIVLGPEIITLLAGPKYLAAAPIILVLSPFPILAFMIGTFGNYLFLQDKPRFILYTGAIGAFLVVILNIFLVPRYGMTGAALATVFSNFAVLIILVKESKGWKLLDFAYLKIGRITFSALLMGALLSFLNPADIASKLAVILSGIGIYLGLLFLTKVFNEKEMGILRPIFRLDKAQ